MSCEEFNHLAGGISSIATTLALIVGGIWTYRRFVRTREAYPKIEFTVDLAFVRKQGGFWVVEAIANMENKGLVRHSIRKFTFDLRYMLPSDAVEVSAPFLAVVPHKASEGSWLPPDWNFTFIEPGLRTRYSCVARIPEQATMALIHGKFYYSDKLFHTADKLFAVPA
jgi:hypothetical protein